MNLPDRFEQVGIVVGSVIMVALPASALGIALVGIDPNPWQVVWLLPGFVVGMLLAAGRLPVTYHQVWAFSLSSYVLTIAGWVALGLQSPPTNRPLGLLVWAGAIGVGALIAWIRPVASMRRLRQHA